eukprot:1150113-Pelagomonas_calceolata.AAC.6
MLTGRCMHEGYKHLAKLSEVATVNHMYGKTLKSCSSHNMCGKALEAAIVNHAYKNIGAASTCRGACKTPGCCVQFALHLLLV